jgi:alpha/beta superfamily hydrolase
MAYRRTLHITVPEGGHALETRITLPAARRGNALVAPPHPSYGGSIDSPVVEALEEALCARQLGTLALNFRGVGESSGVSRGDIDEALVDFLAVARAPEAEPLALLSGYSFGACVALRAAQVLAVESLLLVAPALALFEPALLRAYPGRVTVVVGGEDGYAPEAALRARMPSSSAARLVVLPGVDHFFSGTGLSLLRAALPELLS